MNVFRRHVFLGVCCGQQNVTNCTAGNFLLIYSPHTWALSTLLSAQTTLPTLGWWCPPHSSRYSPTTSHQSTPVSVSQSPSGQPTASNTHVRPVCRAGYDWIVSWALLLFIPTCFLSSTSRQPGAAAPVGPHCQGNDWVGPTTPTHYPAKTGRFF